MVFAWAIPQSIIWKIIIAQIVNPVLKWLARIAASPFLGTEEGFIRQPDTGQSVAIYRTGIDTDFVSIHKGLGEGGMSKNHALSIIALCA
jgi:hypothetical protein